MFFLKSCDCMHVTTKLEFWWGALPSLNIMYWLFYWSYLSVLWICFCLFVWSLSSLSRIFHSYGDDTIAGEGLHILTYARNYAGLWAVWVFKRACPLRHGPTVYDGHLRGPVTLTPVAERLAVELSLPVFTT